MRGGTSHRMAAESKSPASPGKASSWNHFHKAIIESGDASEDKIVRSATRLAAVFGADSGTRFGNTVLHFACAMRPPRPNLVRKLVKKGAHPSQPNAQGETPLHYAAIHGPPEVVRCLLASPRCDVDARDHRGSTALHWAAEQGEEHAVAVVELLLQAGAHPGIVDKQADTAMHCAAREGRFDVYKLLEDRIGKWKLFNKMGFTPLHCACQAGQDAFVEQYLAQHPGHEALVTRGDEETPLLLAVRSRSESTVMVLTASEKGRAALNADDSFGRTPYFVATTMGDRFMTSLLIERGARKDLVVALEMPLRSGSGDSSSSSDLSSRRSQLLHMSSFETLPYQPGAGRVMLEDEELRLHIVAQSPRRLAVDDVTTPGRCSPSLLRE